MSHLRTSSRTSRRISGIARRIFSRRHALWRTATWQQGGRTRQHGVVRTRQHGVVRTCLLEDCATGGAGDAVRVRRVCDGRGRRRGACEAWQSLGACEARTRRGVVLLVANASKYRILLILDRLSRRLHSRERLERP